jgi:hypothetical protein
VDLLKKKKKSFIKMVKKGENVKGGLVLKGEKMKLLWKGGTHVIFKLYKKYFLFSLFIFLYLKKNCKLVE